MGLVLFIANKRYSSWSMRPWVLLKALGIPFEERLQTFTAGLRQPAFLSFSPTGKVPTLLDGDVTVWDSLAIVEYIAEAHPAAWPRDPAARAFARCAAAEMHAGFDAIRDQCSMNVALRIDLGGPPNAALQRDLDRLDQLWTDGLTRFGGPFLAGGEFTAADAFFAPVATRIQTFGLKVSEPAMAYVQTLLEHPAVSQWIKDGIAETAREPYHEADVVRGRKVLKDLSPTQ
ncbi:Glutathione S-transferase domain-containing protein [Colletotrichum higginsianum IMI 349063]|uniref:Glutathione S-transferase domain-containing protein n=3 Tax=Colletotrichum higginsianum TaxID=80884 RepID=A0A1B7Y4U3_COLHI|nr:Glutathione S-transferase domain-containing protein [Colletotrichum higginsianum IMI 349063]OBR07052.1 Glutathione S-transferase domain-containing protein [Colletotrichum higginsianum IMI 349063]TIC92428.1 Glutathione S-transferase 1 [Colletotrichum higginsianum]GJC98822.1 glutathione S-transferase domain-containing protein [Colletotrichum higginsianum]